MLKHLSDKTIAVTGLKTGDNPQPGVGIIRCIRKAGFTGKIVGLIYDSLESGVYLEGLVDAVFTIPFPSASSEALIERYRYINSRFPIDFLIPTLDSELPTYIRLQKAFESLGIKSYLPEENQLMLREKNRLLRFFPQHNIPVPPTEIVTEESQLWELNKKMTYPLFIKGNLYEAYKAYNHSDLMKYFYLLRERWGLPIIVQEMITGDEFNIVVLGDGTGQAVGMIPQRKLIITDKGKGFGGVVIDNPELRKFSEEIIALIKWKSGCELEVIQDSKNGKYYLIEINPRFPAWIRLSEGAGQNLPAMLVKLANGEECEKMTSYQVGTMFIRHSEDLITSMDIFGQVSSIGELIKDEQKSTVYTSEAINKEEL